MKKVKILITSVGSLVGKNLLDVLDFPSFSRRHLVYLIGTNSLIENPNNFRCDKFYNVPNTTSPEFLERMEIIIKNENPDLILSGRDIDTEVVARLIKNSPQLIGKMPYGELKSLSYGLNKWQTWLFTQKYNLPFANTFVLNRSGGVNELKQFVKKFGFPLIAKPIQGFASKGVFFVRNWNQAENLANYDDYMIQEYLGKPDAMDNYFKHMDGPTPLFAHAPDIHHHTCHTVINPNGKVNEFFITKNNHINGATISTCRVENPELKSIAMSYAKAYISEGGYGPFGIQFREDKNGNWKGQEINMRTNGNTFPRLLMGQDDIGLIMNGVLPNLNFPIYKEAKLSYEDIVAKSLSCDIIVSSEIENVRKTLDFEN